MKKKGKVTVIARLTSPSDCFLSVLLESLLNKNKNHYPKTAVMWMLEGIIQLHSNVNKLLEVLKLSYLKKLELTVSADR